MVIRRVGYRRIMASRGRTLGASRLDQKGEGEMDTTAFYAASSALCFTLLGFWWVVVQFRHAELTRDVASRRFTFDESTRLASMPFVIRISNLRPLAGRLVQLTLTDGSIVERDLSGLLDGVGVFERISVDDAAFRSVYVDAGTLAWPGEIDIAPETLIWDVPDPKDAKRLPPQFLRPRKPS
jgi:hypothetical protein